MADCASQSVPARPRPRLSPLWAQFPAVSNRARLAAEARASRETARRGLDELCAKLGVTDLIGTATDEVAFQTVLKEQSSMPKSNAEIHPRRGTRKQKPQPAAGSSPSARSSRRALLIAE